HTDVKFAVLCDGFIAPARVHVRMMAKRQRCGADHKIIHTNLYVFDFVELLPERKQIGDVVISSQIKMRNRSRRLREAFGDRASHRGEGDLLFLEDWCRGGLQAARRAKARLY